MWFYIKSETNLYTVGFEDQSGKWHTDSDHDSKESAAARVHYLNGSHEEESKINSQAVPDLLSALEGMVEPFSHIGGVGRDAKFKAMEAAKAAIKKAKIL